MVFFWPKHNEMLKGLFNTACANNTTITSWFICEDYIWRVKEMLFLDYFGTLSPVTRPTNGSDMSWRHTAYDPHPYGSTPAANRSVKIRAAFHDRCCVEGILEQTYHETCNISRALSQDLFVSRLVLQLSLHNPLKPGVKEVGNEA